MKINKIIGKTLEVACIVALSTLVNLGVNFKTESYVKNEVVSEFKSAIEEIKKDMNDHTTCNTCNEDKLINDDEINTIVGADNVVKSKTYKEDNTIENETIKKPTINESINIPDDKPINDTIISDNKTTSNDNSLIEDKNEPIEEDKIEEIHFTEEDIKRYEEYKEGLINEYGEDVYNLMNQEAGIENEEQSFYHFMKYGI